MDIISLVIILIVLIIVIVVVTRPLFKSPAEEEPTAVKQIAEKSEYEEILGRIRELDFEFGLGKISIEDYHNLRDELLSQAAALIQPAAAELEEDTKKTAF